MLLKPLPSKVMKGWFCFVLFLLVGCLQFFLFKKKLSILFLFLYFTEGDFQKRIITLVYRIRLRLIYFILILLKCDVDVVVVYNDVDVEKNG